MLLTTDLSLHEKFAASAAKISLHNFKWQLATFVLFNSTLSCSVEIFLRSYENNVIVGRGTFYPSFFTRAKQYILFGSDIPDIVQMLSWMKKHQFDNSGKYIVICESERKKDCNETDAINVFWNYKILNIVLINNDRDENKVNGYTYFYPEDCKNTRPMKLKNWDTCLMYGHLNCRNMYPPRLKNLYRCPLTVSTFIQTPYMNITDGVATGADGDLLYIIAKSMNFTLELMTPRIGNGWGKLEENDTWSGSLADVYYEWANFSMTSASITFSRFTTFQLSVDYRVVSVCWVTHPSEAQPSSLKLLRPFQSNVRIALFLTFILVIIFRVILYSKPFLALKRQLNIVIPDDIIFHSWELCMGLPVSSFPTNKAFLILALFWIWFCFLIRTLYQVYLINSLQTDVYSPEFNTIEEAIASKYPYGGGLALKDYYIDNTLVHDNWINVESNEIPAKVIKLSQGWKFVLAMDLETLKMILNNNRISKLHVLPQIVIRSPTVIFFKKYSPLATALNSVLTRLKEYGIVKKIYLDNTSKKKFNDHPDNNIPITMGHYTGCYVILLIGWTLSTLCFVVEKLMRRNKN